MKFLIFFFCIVHGALFSQGITYPWQDFLLGSPALNVRLPDTPMPQSTRLPQSILEKIKRYDGYYIKNENQGIVITLSHVHYAGEITADIRGAVEGSIGQWKATGATVDIKSTLTGSVSGRNGMQVKGTFNADGQDRNFALMVIVEGPKMWQISVLVKANDPDLDQVMQTIIESLIFKE